MSEYLSKEEIRKWRSSLERITLEEYAARLGKVIQEEKHDDSLVDTVMFRSLNSMSSESYMPRTEKIQTLALKSFQKEKELGNKKEMKPEQKKDLILKISGVTKRFPGVLALDNISLEVPKGVVYGIVGENGAGKSTLMKILSGVYEKDAGTIEFDGEVIERTTPIQALHRGLSIIYQEFNLVNTMTVGENIFLGRFSENHGMRGTHKKARELLDSIGSKIDTYALVGDLSASEMQMVEITKALSFDSKLIIMDEPSSSLTAEELKKLIDRHTWEG